MCIYYLIYEYYINSYSKLLSLSSSLKGGKHFRHLCRFPLAQQQGLKLSFLFYLNCQKLFFFPRLIIFAPLKQVFSFDTCWKLFSNETNPFLRHVLWEVRFHQIFWAVILIIDAETEKVTYRLFCLLLIFVYSMKIWSISSSNYSKNDFKTFWLILVFTSWNLSERNRCINFSAGATKKKKRKKEKKVHPRCVVDGWRQFENLESSMREKNMLTTSVD